MHQLAFQIASHSVDCGWISDDDLAICCYAVERRLLSALFFLLQLFIFAPLKKLPEALTFIVVVLSFRRRMGGVHASNEWVCLLISTCSVLGCVFILGPIVECLPDIILYVFDIVLLAYTFYLEPAYPPQVHFTWRDSIGNTHIKYKLLVILMLSQLLSQRLIDFPFVSYSSIGLLFVDITVTIEKHHNNMKGVY